MNSRYEKILKRMDKIEDRYAQIARRIKNASVRAAKLDVTAASSLGQLEDLSSSEESLLESIEYRLNVLERTLTGLGV